MEISKRNIEVLDEQMVEVLKRIKPQERLTIAFNMWSFARKQIANYLHSLHSDWDEKKIQQEVARRLSHGAIRTT
ncbi:MAG: hypothetical protein JSU92_10875 [Deltaproteobacteria bacterium]|nr:MAG: hypothetical protein JSU92_10875 [Deltaproteobacteria bacterium]